MKRFGWLIAIGVILIIILAGVLGFAGSYNGLVKKSQAVDAQWAQVETQYQRRFDLIPNLVNSVKGTMKQEQAIFDAIAQARTQYLNATTTDDKAVAAGALETSFNALVLSLTENYPTLRSSDAVTALMDELAGTENRISVERKRYNDDVYDYNTAIKSFPTNFIAGMFHFSAHDYFASSSGADQPPVVEF
jgi:LemA protein